MQADVFFMYIKPKFQLNLVAKPVMREKDKLSGLCAFKPS
jgi:hypothetical protein